MWRLIRLYQSSVGKKITMATSGLILLLFVVVHMLGNLKVYQGPDKFNAYAEWLREMGAPFFGHGHVLWIVRIVLIASTILHVAAAVQLTRMSYLARTTPYQVGKRLGFSYASYTMRWGGLVILAFVVYHLLHFTWGTAHHDFQPDSAYHNVVSGFRLWLVSLVYIAAMIPLGFHMYHGLWSALQTMGINRPGHNRWRRPLAAFVSLAVVSGNISVPVAVLAGVVG